MARRLLRDVQNIMNDNKGPPWESRSALRSYLKSKQLQTYSSAVKSFAELRSKGNPDPEK